VSKVFNICIQFRYSENYECISVSSPHDFTVEEVFRAVSGAPIIIDTSGTLHSYRWDDIVMMQISEQHADA
jgi:hypothetical protein